MKDYGNIEITGKQSFINCI